MKPSNDELQEMLHDDLFRDGWLPSKRQRSLIGILIRAELQRRQQPEASVPAELVEKCAEAVHDAYLETCAKLGWSVKPENQVPYSDLIESSKELDRASVRATLRVAAAYGRGQSQKAGECCPMCGSPEVEHNGPHTKYACGSKDYDQRPGTFRESERCNRIRLRIPLPPEPPTC